MRDAEEKAEHERRVSEIDRIRQEQLDEIRNRNKHKPNMTGVFRR